MQSMTQIKPINFNDLDELCIESILKFLSLQDLAAISLTCKRCQQEAERHFTLHHEINCEPINIKSTNEDVDFDFKQGHAYERVFEKLIRSVECSFYGTFSIDDCDFIKEYCADKLRSLTLNCLGGRGDERIDGSPLELIKDQLKGLKVLKLINFSVRDVHSDIMCFCESLESLTIEVNRGGHDEYYGVYGNSWLKQSYPHLKTLKLCVPKYLSVHITSFLTLNPNLANLICSNLWSIFDVCQSDAEFQNVSFIFFHEHDFTWTMDAMEKWSKQKRFKEFELVISVYRFEDNVMRGMATTFENITSLHLGYNIHFFSDFNLNFSLPSVKMLCVKFYEFLEDAIQFALLNQFFPNLCKLKMKVGIDSCPMFVRRFKKVKNFEFINEECDLCMLSKYTYC